MRAFVIKNKEEDRYLYTFYIYEDENFAFGELNEAKLFDNLDNANDYKERIYWVNSNLKLEVVPITIAECDIEKENEELNEALYWACNYITRIVDKDVNKLPHEWADYFIQQAKEKLK